MTDTESALVTRYSVADLPTEYGMFRVVVYREPVPGPGPSAGVHGAEAGAGVFKEHCAIVNGDVRGASDVLTRVHSECLTGEVLHSLKCDCREQLDLGLRRIAQSDRGVVLYLRQEGRGIGLGNKIRAYDLQNRGVDTVDANTQLGFAPDQRRYRVATEMLEDLGVRSVVLMTNNPLKVDALRDDGVVVTRRVNHHIEPNDINRGYLETKRDRMGHHLDNLAAEDAEEAAVEQNGRDLVAGLSALDAE